LGPSSDVRIESLLHGAICLALAWLTWSAAPLSAQELPLVASADELRARASARGYVRAPAVAGEPETWCASPPCAADADRLELHVVGGALVQVRARISDAADGFALDATWQSSGAFTFRFARGDEHIELTWELTYEHPRLAVAFSGRRLEEIIVLDPADGTHAFALWIRRELARHLAAPESLREVSLASRAALRAHTESALRTSGTIRDRPLAECLVERSTGAGTGMFDECPLRPATPEEQREVLAALDARLSMERRLLRAHARAFHRAIRELLAAPDPR
jgi:hypothetical protein